LFVKGGGKKPQSTPPKNKISLWMAGRSLQIGGEIDTIKKKEGGGGNLKRCGKEGGEGGKQKAFWGNHVLVRFKKGARNEHSRLKKGGEHQHVAEDYQGVKFRKAKKKKKPTNRKRDGKEQRNSLRLCEIKNGKKFPLFLMSNELSRCPEGLFGNETFNERGGKTVHTCDKNQRSIG